MNPLTDKQSHNLPTATKFGQREVCDDGTTIYYKPSWQFLTKLNLVQELYIKQVHSIKQVDNLDKIPYDSSIEGQLALRNNSLFILVGTWTIYHNTPNIDNAL